MSATSDGSAGITPTGAGMSSDVMSATGPFSQKALGWIVGLGVGSLVVGFALSIFSKDLFGDLSIQADTYSESAIGHSQWKRLLEHLEVPVVVSRNHASRMARRGSVLIIAEPNVEDTEEGRRFEDLLWSVEHAVVVLPKWKGAADQNRIHVRSVEEADSAESVLDRIATAGDLRINPPTFVRGGWNRGEFSVDPELEFPQLITGTGFDSLVSCPSGSLVVEVELEYGPTVTIVSDPDWLANHGIGNGDNGALAVELANRYRDEGGRVVFDESLHGFTSAESIWRTLFRFPYLLATGQAFLIICALVWGGMGRFGALIRIPKHLQAGKELLLNNGAQLADYCGYSGHALDRMLRDRMRAVARAFHAPPNLAQRDLPAWLERVSNARGVSIDLTAISRQVRELARHQWGDERRVLRLARRIHNWNQEILHGAPDGSRSGTSRSSTPGRARRG